MLLLPIAFPSLSPDNAPSLWQLFANSHNALATQHYDFCRLQTRFDGTLGLEDLREFFESAILRFHEEEIDADKLERVPRNEQEIVLPAC